MINLKTKEDMSGIQKSCAVLANYFDYISDKIKEGVSTKDIDKLTYEFITKNGGVPAFLNFHGFPASVCTSVNCEVIHGIPSSKVILKDGDIIGIDCGVNLGGYFSDSAYTYMIGNVKKEVKDLVEVTKESLDLAIEAIKIDGRIKDISKAVSKRCHGYGIVEDFCGHGVGFAVHEEPEIPNYYSELRSSPKIKNGMVLAIEPMINLGTKQVIIKSDKWTVETKDKKPSAHFEHTVAIFDDEVHVLTKR